MNFNNLKIQTKVNQRSGINRLPEIKDISKPIVNKRIGILDPTLAYYQKVYQYCDGCKTEMVFDIIMGSLQCKVCGHHYKIGERIKEVENKPVYREFFLL